MIIDACTGTVQNDIPCLGPRVLCAVLVGQRIWLGTEVLNIIRFYFNFDLDQIYFSVLEGGEGKEL